MFEVKWFNTTVLKVQWQTYSCVKDPVIQLSLPYRFIDIPIIKLKVQYYTYHCVKIPVIHLSLCLSSSDILVNVLK